MLSAHFTALPSVICRQLQNSRTSIKVAVCWVDHPAIFQAMLRQLKKGVQVTLITEFDDRNFGIHGLDFDKFSALGGQLRVNSRRTYMHHKFAVLDESVVLTGSYNWTVNFNEENLLVSDDPRLVARFVKAFAALEAKYPLWSEIAPKSLKTTEPAGTPLSPPDVHSLRKAVVSDARVWYLVANRDLPHLSVLFNHSCICFGRIKPIDRKTTPHAPNLESSPGRYHKILLQKIQIGDIILYGKDCTSVDAVGRVSSDPFSDKSDKWQYVRIVAWRICNPALSPESPFPANRVGRYKGSALRLLNALENEERMVKT